MAALHRALFVAGGVGFSLALAFGPLGCEVGPTAAASGVLTSTVTLDRFDEALVVDSVLPVAVIGARRSDVLVEVELTITASSAEVAERALAAYAIQVEGSGGTRVITAAGPSQGRASGLLRIEAPRDLPLEVSSKGGSARVEGMAAAVAIQAVGPVQLLDARSDAVVRVEVGGAQVDTPLRPGQRVDVGAGSGDVVIALPANPDGRFDAEAPGGVASAHPALPSRPGGVPYGITRGAGLASVVATTRAGTVRFTVRREN